MKTKMIIALITLAGGFSHACIGGHLSNLISSQEDTVATLDKNEQTITLAEGASLTYISNCEVDSEVKLTQKQYSVKGYIDSNHDLCFGIKLKDQEAKFRITEDEMDARPKGINSCGGKIYSN